MTNTDLFSEFSPVSKADWLQQIAKDLKGKPLEDLQWQAPDGQIISPWVHADDFDTPLAPISNHADTWEICEDVHVNDLTIANRSAMEALEGGAEGLCFWLEHPLELADLEQLLQGIHLDFIGLHFAGKAVSDNPGIILGFLDRIAQKRGLNSTQLRGSLAYDPVPVSKTVDWRYLAELVEYAREKFPLFKVIQVSSSENSSGQTATLLYNAHVYLQKLSERGISAHTTANALQFSIEISKSYFFEIARLRALKLLWFNVLNAWGAAPKNPVVQTRFLPETYSDDLYTNMIRGTTMAMAAVQGGTSQLIVKPYDAGREAKADYPQAFSRRIARNVQHLLKMESALDEVPDPAAGSYYIETLTQQIAGKAWEDFQLHHTDQSGKSVEYR
jgi:methylmalonyl-CoA mutase